MLAKPRILCLHGGGVSARIFELQMRYLIKGLARDFRLVFADGPWPCEMHDDLKPVYAHLGPCYRWANWKVHPPPPPPLLDDSSAIQAIECALVKAMGEDEGEGEWVGLLGFSQGATLAFSILLENQLRRQSDPPSPPFAGVSWRFGVIMAGRAPPFNLSPCTQKSHHHRHCRSLITQPPPQEQRTEAWYSDPFLPHLRTPTLHVHGLRDGGLELHRDLLERFASPAHARLVEWDGAHRIPFRSADVENIAGAILEVAKLGGVLGKGAPAA